MAGDIDHVAIGPAGVLSVQTKWTADHWSLAVPEADDRLAAAAGMHERNTTERLGAMVRHAAPNAELIPLLVCWGPRVEAGEQAVARLRSARIVAGYDSERWLKRLTAERLGAEEVGRIAHLINARIADEERALGKTLEQRHRTLRITRRSTRLAVGALAWCVVTVTFVIVSSVWSPLGDAMNRLFRYTGSAVPGLWLLSVVPLSLAAMLQARRLRKRLRRFEQPVAVASRNLAIAVSALLIWIGLFVGAVIAAR